MAKGRPIAEPRRIAISYDAALLVLAVGHDHPRIQPGGRCHAAAHRARIGGLDLERGGAAGDVRRIDRGDCGGILRPRRPDRDHSASFASTAFIRLDRKSVVLGKSVSVRVDLGGRRLIKKNKDIKQETMRVTKTSNDCK